MRTAGLPGYANRGYFIYQLNKLILIMHLLLNKVYWKHVLEAKIHVLVFSSSEAISKNLS
jgi:hypothetical protein